MTEQPGRRCPIWGTEATVYPPAERWITVDSERAGGRYRLPISYAIGSQKMPDGVRARLTTWLVDQRRMGEKDPFATDEKILAAGTAALLSPSNKIDRFFLALADAKFDPLGQFVVAGAVDDDFRKWNTLFGVWTESDHPNGGLAILQLLEDRHWIQPLGGSGRYRLTASGVDELEKRVAGRIQFDQGFVAMWFGDELRKVYDEGFAVGIAEAGYKAMRIDRKEHNNKIDDEIIAEIRRSRFLVADMTCPIHKIDGQPTALARGGVYYEAGFAHGLNVPVIWTAREGMADYLHFDIRQYAHIIWKDAADLREKLKVRIGAVLGYGPRAP